MKRLLLTTLIIAFVMAVLSIPLLFWIEVDWAGLLNTDQNKTADVFGSSDEVGADGIGHTKSRTKTACIVIALLTGDIFLPVPSSVVVTFAGNRLGIPVAVVVCWLGLCLSNLIGYGIGIAGKKYSRKIVNEKQISDAHSFVARFGAVAVLFLRPIPILSEASTVVAGLYKMPFFQFLAAVATANLVLTLGYAFLGSLAESSEGLFLLAVLAAIFPLALLFLIKPLFRKVTGEGND